MSAIRIARKASEEPEIAGLVRLRDEWEGARRRLDPSALSGACSMPGCRTMPFVALKTTTGRRPLCLRHFEMLRVEMV